MTGRSWNRKRARYGKWRLIDRRNDPRTRRLTDRRGVKVGVLARRNEYVRKAARRGRLDYLRLFCRCWGSWLSRQPAEDHLTARAYRQARHSPAAARRSKLRRAKGRAFVSCAAPRYRIIPCRFCLLRWQHNCTLGQWEACRRPACYGCGDPASARRGLRAAMASVALLIPARGGRAPLSGIVAFPVCGEPN
jgi:hypothetical protein